MHKRHAVNEAFNQNGYEQASYITVQYLCEYKWSYFNQMIVQMILFYRVQMILFNVYCLPCSIASFWPEVKLE